MMETKLELAEGTITELVADFLYYDRKGDEKFTLEDLRELIDSGQLTKEMVIQWFTKQLTDNWETYDL